MNIPDRERQEEEEKEGGREEGIQVSSRLYAS